jgi:hypothetical protein
MAFVLGPDLLPVRIRHVFGTALFANAATALTTTREATGSPPEKIHLYRKAAAGKKTRETCEGIGYSFLGMQITSERCARYPATAA